MARPHPPSAWSVWAAGDVATAGARADRVAALVRRGEPDRLSDLAMCMRPARLKDFRRWYHPRFGRLARITDPTIGNHEWDNRFQGYYRYWYRRKGWPLAALVQDRDRRLGDPQPELAGAAPERLRRR